MPTYYYELNGGRIQTTAKFSGGEVYVVPSGGGGGGTMQSKSVSYTPSETAISATVSPDYGYDGLSSVSVSVGAISSSYVGSDISRRDSTDLSVSGGTVTVPAGYYASNASATIAPASTPTIDSRSVDSSGYVTVDIEIDNGGFIATGTYEATDPVPLPTQAAQTIHPSTSDQTIAANKYLTGAQTIKGVTYSGLDAGNIKKDVVVKIGDSADDDRIVSVTGTYDGGGGGDTQLYYNSSGQGTFYAENTITPSDNPGNFLQRLKGASHLKTIKCMQANYGGGSSTSIVSAFQGCSLLEEVTLLNGISTSGYAEDVIKDCPNIKTFTTGGIGYPNTVGMGAQSGSYQTFRNVTIPFDIIIYTTATDLASLPSYLRTGSPWGATNATIIYKNSVTGEVLT